MVQTSKDVAQWVREDYRHLTRWIRRPYRDSIWRGTDGQYRTESSIRPFHRGTFATFAEAERALA